MVDRYTIEDLGYDGLSINDADNRYSRDVASIEWDGVKIVRATDYDALAAKVAALEADRRTPTAWMREHSSHREFCHGPTYPGGDGWVPLFAGPATVDMQGFGAAWAAACEAQSVSETSAELKANAVRIPLPSRDQEMETVTKSCACDEADGYLCGKNEDGLSCACRCHTLKTRGDVK